MAEPREGFELNQVVCVLSHYDLGVISNVEIFARGSPKAPKLLLTAERGAFLLKRRAPGKDDPIATAFSHGLQLHLAHKNFPLPHLVGTRGENNSMVQMDRALYELFEYIPGTKFDYSKESTFQSGRTLALFHKLTNDYQTTYTPPPGGNYHANPNVLQACDRLETLLDLDEIASAGERPAAKAQLAKLRDTYEAATAKIEALGLSTWPVGLVHADFHPGNCLYKQEHVVAVIDFDSCRLQQRILDAANAALQFSIQLGAGNPRTWKVHLHAARLQAFVHGYESLRLLTEAELAAIPWLMIESMTCEVLLGLKGSGQMAKFSAPAWLAMLDGKVNWVQDNAALLIKALNAPAPSE